MKILKTIVFALFSVTTACAQKRETKNEDYLKNVDYTIRTDIINSDTLQGDQKNIFWHFAKLSYKEAKNLEPHKIKSEFDKIGITTKENDRFADAYIFYKTYYIGHKKDCEYFAYFEFLKPKAKN